MATTIYKPALARSKAAALINQRVGELYDCARQVGRARRVAQDNLTIDFMHLGSFGIHFRVREGFDVLLRGRLDPSYPGKYAHGRLEITRWVRGRWEESFGVPMLSYDPHWDDRVPPALKKAIRKAASSPRSEAAKHVVDLMISYADVRFEDIIEFTVNGGPDAADHAGIVISLMLGPNMAAVVPIMMWLNGVTPAHVLNAYVEAHDKMGVRRRHLKEILGTGERVTDFLVYATGATALEHSIETLRAMSPGKATGLIDAIGARCGPLVQQMFPEGIHTFLRRFLSKPDLSLRQTLARRRSGLFS